MKPPAPTEPTGPHGWKKFFAVMGIIGGFFFLLTIPGWIALSTYNKWKRGERDEPGLLIGWGALVSLCLAVTFVIGVVAGVADPTTDSAPASSPTLAPPGTTAPVASDEWTEHTAEGFSLSLPSSWDATEDTAGRKLKLIAQDGDGAILQVIQLPGPRNKKPSQYFEFVRFMIASNKRSTSKVLMEPVTLPAGKGYVFHGTVTSPSGPASMTMYAWLHRESEYRLLFITMLGQQEEYAPVFEDIARTFSPLGP